MMSVGPVSLSSALDNNNSSAPTLHQQRQGIVPPPPQPLQMHAAAAEQRTVDPGESAWERGLKEARAVRAFLLS